MNINRFFTTTLGARLKNARWSWGAADPMNHRIYLRVWDDAIVKRGGKEYVTIDRDVPRRPSSGVAERHRHVEEIRAGADGYGVVCVAVDPSTIDVRRIKSFDDQFLIRFGEIIKDGGETRAEIIARVSTRELAYQRTGEGDLPDDLQSIARQRIDATTKEALVNARVGQGLFRQQVLKNWAGVCAVTGSAVLDAIRASHIKPWRVANNSERLDSLNGLPLIASYDALFDAGLITFDEDGRLLASSRLSSAERSIFGLAGRSLSKTPPNGTVDYLKYHRSAVFRA